jgi:Protein of unknown function (DUF5672)
MAVPNCGWIYLGFCARVRQIGLLAYWGGVGRAGTLRGASKIYEENCDIFWGQLVPKLVRNFRVAPPEVAVKFSWEVVPSRCYTLSNGDLPFGLHAWARYDFGFLKPLLERSGVELR